MSDGEAPRSIRRFWKFPVESGAMRALFAKDDVCPECGGELDTGWECNECGYDASDVGGRS